MCVFFFEKSAENPKMRRCDLTFNGVDVNLPFNPVVCLLVPPTGKENMADKSAEPGKEEPIDDDTKPDECNSGDEILFIDLDEDDCPYELPPSEQDPLDDEDAFIESCSMEPRLVIIARILFDEDEKKRMGPVPYCRKLCKDIKRQDRGSIVFELRGKPSDERLKEFRKMLISQLETAYQHLEEAKGKQVKVELFKGSEFGGKGYYFYRYCKGDKVEYKGKEGVILRRNGGRYTYDPQYKIQLTDGSVKYPQEKFLSYVGDEKREQVYARYSQ